MVRSIADPLSTWLVAAGLVVAVVAFVMVVAVMAVVVVHNEASRKSYGARPSLLSSVLTLAQPSLQFSIKITLCPGVKEICHGASALKG